MRGVEDAERARVAALAKTGMSIRDIAEETGIHRSTVHRLRRRIVQEAAEARAGAEETAAAPVETAAGEAGAGPAA